MWPSLVARASRGEASLRCLACLQGPARAPTSLPSSSLGLAGHALKRFTEGGAWLGCAESRWAGPQSLLCPRLLLCHGEAESESCLPGHKPGTPRNLPTSSAPFLSSLSRASSFSFLSCASGGSQGPAPSSPQAQASSGWGRRPSGCSARGAA